MNDYRRWTAVTLTLILIPLLLVGGFNYTVDPLWCFAHSNQFNMIQMSFNERQQKTNYLTFAAPRFDTLIMGSSRVTYINQYDFTGHRAYNYALNNMLLADYYEYARYASEQNGQEFATIILGLDFYATNKTLALHHDFAVPDYYITESNRWGYRYANLLSADALKYAYKNYTASRSKLSQNYAYYRNGVKILEPIDPAEKKWRVQANIDFYGQTVYGSDYQYDEVKTAWQSLRDDHPQVQFIVFTTPVSDVLFQLMAEQGLLPAYEQWLTDCVEVFGSVYNFMYPNSITTNLDNYYDASHFYPPVGTLIAHRIIEQPDPNLPPDFGVQVNADNLVQHMEMVKQLVREGEG